MVAGYIRLALMMFCAIPTSGPVFFVVYSVGTFAGGLLNAYPSAILSDVTRPEERPRWFGLFGTINGASLLIGLLGGGLVVDHLGPFNVFWFFAPWGVVASVTPSTNPAATVINNAISLIAAGNSVIFAPHPAAKKVSQRAITLLNQAIVAAGGPENLLVTVANPDIETAQRLFKFPGIGLLVVTGGEAVVEAARKHTNKRLIAAGAGNPPVVVDETADLARAAQSIVKGASFDNNIICADEKVLIVVDSVADELMRLMEGQHAVKLTAEQAQQLQPVLLKNIDERGKGTVSRDWVGRDAAKIAAAIGLNVPQETRLLFVETTAEHPFAVTELMMPVLPVVRVANVADAIALAVKLEGGCHHTAAMHSRNIENMNQMANAIDTSIFVKNGPCIAGLGLGGEGWTTMTITTPTGEGVTSARTFVRLRRCVLVDAFRIV